ncbi:lipid II flippase MurJ [Winogradskyella sp. SYSU M77433]|uniref:murein biosynthesis integral membrane protein MurJ n=1 Tax=Winogradskyella sp. SYSU M77433 TaxID=3042722 RepID=UPI0024805594|nr:lipid II flippase MurJ [Winogradskyella sp. SYSU M77433]MDH7913952.1 lipid II flippase MurJ [Winogradskyella sp. SYSU M77433]
MEPKNSYKLLTRLKSYLKNPVLRSMLIVAIVTFFIKGLAFYKETVIASSFGLSEVLDTFLVAVLIPTFVQSVFLNSLKNLFIPNYIIEIKNGSNKGGFQSLVFLMTLIVSLVSILVCYFFMDFFLENIYPGHTENYYALVKNQLNIILPSLVLWGFSTVISGLLEVDNKFFVATIHQFFPLIIMLLFLFFLKENLGDKVLAYGTLVGSLSSFLFLLTYAIYSNKLLLSKPAMNTNSKMMLSQLPPKITSSFLSSMNNFIDQFFAGQLVVGSIAALNYGNRIPAFGVTIVIMALGSVLLPHFSRLVNTDINLAYKYLFKILKIVVSTSVIVVIIVIFFSDVIVEIWLERNEFTHDDTIKVSLIQKILLFNVPFYLCTLIMVKFLTSINKNSFMAKISFVNLMINILLNIILIKYYDVYGLALSTSFVLIISSCFYFRYTYKEYKKIS